MNVDVLVVGAGPAGLAAAIELRRAGVDRVLVADREQAAGGVPRHCQHTGFGARDLHRVLTGPGYARRYAADAARLGAEIRTETTVTGWAGDRELTLTSPRRHRDGARRAPCCWPPAAGSGPGPPGSCRAAGYPAS